MPVPPTTIAKLCLPTRLYNEMQAQVIHIEPQEACGLIGGTIHGKNYTAKALFPLTNMLHSAVRYRMEPGEQLAALETIDAQGWQLVGIYHSHPAGPEMPSPTDIAEAYYPEAVYLIWFKQASTWQCRGFSIREGRVAPVSIDACTG